MKSKYPIIFCAILAVLLAACQGLDTVQTAKPTAPADPQPGKATMTGRLLYQSTGEPMSVIGVRLAEIVRQGEQSAMVLDTAFGPGDMTDEQGYFIFENIDPKEYVIVVGNIEIYQGYTIVPNDEGTARIWQTEDGKVVDVGELKVDFKQ
ncbi:MAG: hypothetical protein EHM70_11875 [Chloroflexota bacterium]|nr:MAG: hypothetical protein EHM70_11875 [Chloroflexota bacterium]